jgi:acyl carrier protein
MPDAETTVQKTIRSLLKRRKKRDVEFDRNADLYEDLGLDSLEVAELSATLEDDLGSDPYSQGETPRTVGEVLDFYDR